MYAWNLDGTRKILYRLPELLEQGQGSQVFIVEGEKDVDNLRTLGLECSAGLTDSLAVRTYKRLYDPDFGSIAELL